jgi:hypothetical protein
MKLIGAKEDEVFGSEKTVGGLDWANVLISVTIIGTIVIGLVLLAFWRSGLL